MCVETEQPKAYFLKLVMNPRFPSLHLLAIHLDWISGKLVVVSFIIASVQNVWIVKGLGWTLCSAQPHATYPTVRPASSFTWNIRAAQWLSCCQPACSIKALMTCSKEIYEQAVQSAANLAHFVVLKAESILLLLVCVSFTIIGQPRNSVLIRRV